MEVKITAEAAARERRERDLEMKGEKKPSSQSVLGKKF